MNVVAVIPARMASTRFPGKPLHRLAGKPMIQWVYEAVSRSHIPSAVLVATPDIEIASAAASFGAEAMMTRDDHPSGTDRIGEIAPLIGADAYINVQGDEPLLPPEDVDACAELLIAGHEMASLYVAADASDCTSSAVVKVVTDIHDRALYFSRASIPFRRNAGGIQVKRHVGIYGYTHDLLSRFLTWKPTPLEDTEMLEQLRFLEHGVPIQMAPGIGSRISVDTPEQALEASKLLEKEFAR